MDQSKVGTFLRDIDSRMKLSEQISSQHSKKLALKFDSLRFLNWNENKVSQILAFLLDPHADHQQGDTFLQLFVKYFEIKVPAAEVSKVIVKLEDTTLNNRRVDIVISYNGNEYLIGIENKIYPWTKDQNNQIKDYLHHLASMSKHYILFYLSPKSKELSENSAGDQYKVHLENKTLRLINYEDHIIALLKQFAVHSENERVRNFIADFELRLRKEYFGNDNLTNNTMITSYIKENPENLTLAFAISNNLNEVKSELKKDLQNQMIVLANELNIFYDQEHNHFVLDQLKNTYVKYSYEFSGIIYGIVKDIRFRERNPDKFECNGLKEHLKIKFNSSSWWPIYVLKYKNIEVEDQFWIDIVNGKFKNFMKDFIVKIASTPEHLLNQADRAKA